MLDDGHDLMVFRVRNKDPQKNHYAMTLSKNGTIVSRPGDTFSIEELKTWKSATTGTTYPAQWRILIPAHNVSLTVSPLVANQEMNLGGDSPLYWEGAVRIEGSSTGHGYAELTGYNKPIGGTL